MISTNIEQSVALAQAGLPTVSADMYWRCNYSVGEKFYRNYPDVIEDGQILDKDDIPAWSLTALFKLLPTECCVGIIGLDYYYASEPYGFLTDDYKEPVEAAYHLVMHLLQDGYKYDSKLKSFRNNNEIHCIQNI